MPKKIPQDILEILQAVTAKRAKTVIGHIIDHGHITTEELKEQYGYNHPPRAARDVREQGIPLETFNVKDSTGRAIGAYRFGNLDHYMLVCSSCNRAKSWSCEHCANWLTKHAPKICTECYWASPLEYKHIAMQDIRRLAMVWQDDEISQYDSIKEMAAIGDEDMPSFVKSLIRKQLKR